MCYNAEMVDNVEKIKEKLSIEEVVSWYVQLKPAGSSLKARCPFHAEKTPSFVVSPLRGTYHCFGCGVGGDMFSFVQAVEGIDFKGALKMLAEKAGVTLAFDKDAQKSDKDILYGIVEEAVTFYEAQLAQNEPARKYLLSRGLSPETIVAFKLGFAPDSWDSLYTHMRSKGYPEKDIERTGLIKKSEKNNGYYDRFRSRIMFPINDSIGRPVGFSGRIFGNDTAPSASSGQAPAKYINSPETELYDKSSVLFGFDKAKQAMRRNNFAVVVEGQMDLLLSHQIKYANTIALSGTALTETQVRTIGRLTQNVIIALDADTAGIDATRKSARAALLAGFDVKVTALPESNDPADVIQKGGLEEWKRIIKNAQHIIPFLFAYTRAHTTDERTFALRASKEVLPFIHYIQSPVDRAHFIRLSSRELSVPEHVIESELVRTSTNQKITQHSTTQTQIAVPKETPRSSALYFLRWREHHNAGAHIRAELTRVLGAEVLAQALQELPDNPHIFFTLEQQYDVKEIDTIERDIVTRLERSELEQQVQLATTRLKRAESAGDSAAIGEALAASEAARKAMSAFQESASRV